MFFCFILFYFLGLSLGAGGWNFISSGFILGILYFSVLLDIFHGMTFFAENGGCPFLTSLEVEISSWDTVCLFGPN